MTLNGPTTWLIRHAESEGNAGRPTETPASNPLTERGHAQAGELAARFEQPPDVVVLSPYLRTQQTAAPLIARFPQVLVEEWPVQEFTFLAPAKYAGTTEAQRRSSVQAYFAACDPMARDGLGAESFEEFIGRVDSMLLRALELRDSWNVIFTHGYVMKAVLWRQQHPQAAVDRSFMAGFLDFHRCTVVANGEIIRLA